MTIEKLLVEYGGIVAESQDTALARLADLSWSYDKRTERLAFEDGTTLRVGILGTFAPARKSWLWAWANNESRLSATTLANSLRMRAFGAWRQLELFTLPEHKLDASEVQALAIAATGLLGARAFYLGELPQVTVLFTIEDEAVPALGPPSLPVLASTFTSLIARHDIVDHERAFVAYVTARGLEARSVGGTQCVSLGASQLVATFDQLRRLTHLSVNSAPPSPDSLEEPPETDEPGEPAPRSTSATFAWPALLALAALGLAVTSHFIGAGVLGLYLARLAIRGTKASAPPAKRASLEAPRSSPRTVDPRAALAMRAELHHEHVGGGAPR
jgi:hypothetical protein